VAFPFGDHPTFAEYIAWARTQRCTVAHGVDTRQSIPVTRITAPSGKWVSEAGTLPNDRLTPTTIGRLDRRLGLVSPWFSVLPISEVPPTKKPPPDDDE
jgi:hypothetical protein